MVGPGIWRETLKNVQNEIVKNQKNVENETQTLYDLEYIEKH